MKKIKKLKYSNKDISKLLVFPKKDANKYSRGTAYIIAGSNKYPGAAILCSRAAERAGSGYTKLFSDKKLITQLATATPSIPVDDFSAIELRDNDASKPCAYLIGPGLVPDSIKNIEILTKLLDSTDAPVIIDGGALSALKNQKVVKSLKDRSEKSFSTIITPHLGEAKAILGTDSSDIKMSDLAARLLEGFPCICVLKGPDTYISDGNSLYIMKAGTSALAKAGSGDVLAGIISGIVCQGRISCFDACVLATNIHAIAGKIASKKSNEISVNAMDLIDEISTSINSIL